MTWNVLLISTIWLSRRISGLTFLYLFQQSGLTLSSDGILGPLNSDLPAEGLDLSDAPPADESDGISEKESD